MAPSRRRSASKAAAAAACRQWKVGDLVLAKVKGFPAWPATVSEPEKWGYRADWKKVLVFFFGTQQIAFCNPADVEAFTEEKKQSLLVKRQGKGADFVRAVQEIIDSFEKLKKQEQVDFNSVDEIALTNGANSVVSSAQFELKDQTETETSEATVTGRNDPNLPTDTAPDARQVGSSHDKEALLEEPSDNVTVMEKMIITTSRKRSGGLRSRKHVIQKKASPDERSKSSSWMESCRFQNFAMQSNEGNKSVGDLSTNEGNKSVGDLSTNVIEERCLRRNKRIRKSPDASEWDDLESSDFVSNGSIEDNGSEIFTGDSDSLSLNDGSTMDSSCKLENSETVVKSLEGDVELSKGLDFQLKAVFMKKKRKPNRKRATNEAVEQTPRPETEIDLEGGIHISSHKSQNAFQNSNDKYNKEDGDEHLPLVKRARVRMSKASSLEEEQSSFSEVEEKNSVDVAANVMEEQGNFCQAEERNSNDVAVNTVMLISPSTKCDNDCPDTFAVKGASDIASPSKACVQILGNGPQLLRVRENQSFVCSADGEAALPPSKRLHRALEAMSANAAEEGECCAGTSTTKSLVNDGSNSSMKSSSDRAIESKESNGSGEQRVNSHGNRASAICSSSNTVLEESIKSLDPDIYNQPINICKSQEPFQDVIPEAMDHDRGQVHLTSNLDKIESSPQCNGGLLDKLFLKNECNSKDMELRDFEADNPTKGHGTSEHSRMGPNLISQADEAAKVTSQGGTNVLHYSAEDTSCENAGSLRSHMDENSQANGMCEVAINVKYDQRQKDANYVFVDHMSDKDVLGTQSSPFPADGAGTPAQMSPPTTSTCHVSTSESANGIQNSGCSSPNGYSHQKRSVCASVADEEKIESVVPQIPKSKLSNCSEAHAALSSFEGVLVSLTRTKESIGRATRMAIDCAKFGASAKVVEILAHSLESESSLHRRVDLFFLVDSITQCSRGLKGDVGGIYPSAIQAVLPRLLSAAAPPGSSAQENRRQCLKVLRLWLERRILPESLIRHHMRELESLGGSSSAGAYSRRSARNERALDDPVRDMEGMLVDEYGSNSSFQLPGFCMPRMLKDEDDGSDSDGESFEAVTPEHNMITPEEQETTYAVEKHTHILEDVDGELEMEDVAPPCEVETVSTGGITGLNAAQNLHDQFEQQFPTALAPQLLHDVPPSLPPLPLTPPPPPPPPPLPPPPLGTASCATTGPYANGASDLYTNSHNMEDDLRSVSQQSTARSFNSSTSNAVHYCASECRDQMQSQLCESNSSSGGYPARSVNKIQHPDGPGFHHKPYPPRPPHPPPLHQFSYVQAGQYAKSRRETPPPSYSHRFHSSHNTDGGNFYNNRERMRAAPYERDESWRFPDAFPGPRYHDEAKASYSHAPYSGPLREPARIPHQRWAFPRGTHHRNFMHFRPPSNGVGPVANRAPSIWRPR